MKPIGAGRLSGSNPGINIVPHHGKTLSLGAIPESSFTLTPSPSPFLSSNSAQNSQRTSPSPLLSSKTIIKPSPSGVIGSPAPSKLRIESPAPSPSPSPTPLQSPFFPDPADATHSAASTPTINHKGLAKRESGLNSINHLSVLEKGGKEHVSLDDLTKTRRTGIVDNVKKSYGFIKDQLTENRFFFHFTEVKNEEDHNTHQKLHNSQPLRLSQLSQTSKISEEGDEIPEDQLRRISEKEEDDMEDDMENEEMKQDESQSQSYEKSDVKEPLSDEDAELPVGIGDLVEFSVVMDEENDRTKAVKVLILKKSAVPESVARKSHQRSKTLSALKSIEGGETILVNLLMTKGDVLLSDSEMNVGLPNPEGSRETGIVVSTKNRYGFLKCADRQHKQVFFHFSELWDPNQEIEIKQGASVEFTLSKNLKGKPVATQLRVLPSGTVKFDMVKEGVLIGRIRKGIKTGHSPITKSRKRIKPTAKDIGHVQVADKLLEFTGIDLKDPSIMILEGDDVSLKLKVDKRTGAQSATEIVLIRPSPVGRERGMVAIVKEKFGFIRVEDDEVPNLLFFHKNEVIDREMWTITAGDEVEFNIDTDNLEQQNAVRVSKLEPDSVDWSKIWYEGIVIGNSASSSVLAAAARSNAVATDPASRMKKLHARAISTDTGGQFKERFRIAYGNIDGRDDVTEPFDADSIDIESKVEDSLRIGCSVEFVLGKDYKPQKLRLKPPFDATSIVHQLGKKQSVVRSARSNSALDLPQFHQNGGFGSGGNKFSRLSTNSAKNNDF